MRTRLPAFLLAVVGVVAWLIADQTPPLRREGPALQAGRGTIARSKEPASNFRGQTNSLPRPTIGHLETRDRTVTVTVGANGPVYTVRTKDGRLLYENLSGRELRAKAPGLYDLVTGGYARNTSNQGVKLDASVRVSCASESCGR